MRKIPCVIWIGLLCAISVAQGNIKVGDNLNILIKGVPVGEKGKIEGRYVVGAAGTIRLPLANVDVKAAGRTPEVLARSIEKVYQDQEIYSAPTVQVISNQDPEPARAVVSIGGQVKKPGPVPFQPGMTLLQVVQAAGDLTPFGTKKRIFLTRGKERFKLDLRKPEHQAYPVKVGDTIVVDQKGAWDTE